MTTISRGFRVVSLVSLAALVGCGLLGKKGGDAADAEAEAAAVVEAAEAAPPAVAAPTATNENDVSRFPDEKKLENVVGTLQRTTNVREIPGIGKIVATLAKGGTVTEIAQRSTFFLVVFQNPKDNTTLMGWIGQESFTAPPAVEAGVPSIKCVLPETALISDAPFCGKVCTADTDCPSGQACKAPTNKLLPNGQKGDAVNACIVFTPPPAGRALVDASAPIRPISPIIPTQVIPPPPANVGVIAATGGKCPADFSLIKDGQCHRNCAKIGGCPASAPLCLNCAGPKVCAANRDICK
jgi:hypothetical protein